MRASGVAALAGRRPSKTNLDDRSVDVEVNRMRDEIQNVFIAQRVQMIVSSAAAGVDLLGLLVAGSLGIRRVVVLPFSAARFRGSSVADCGAKWAALFDQILEDVTADGEVVVLNDHTPAEQAYRRANHAILQRALAAAGASAGRADPLAIAVWEGQRHGGSDLTAEFVDEAGRLGFRVIQILTTKSEPAS